MKTKDEYIESLASELKEWSAQINLLAAKTGERSGRCEAKCVQELDAFRAKQHDAAEKMKELEETGGDARVTLKETAG